MFGVKGFYSDLLKWKIPEPGELGGTARLPCALPISCGLLLMYSIYNDLRLPASLETNGVYLDQNWASFALRVKSTAKMWISTVMAGRAQKNPAKCCKSTHLNLAHTQLVSDTFRYSWAVAVWLVNPWKLVDQKHSQVPGWLLTARSHYQLRGWRCWLVTEKSEVGASFFLNAKAWTPSMPTQKKTNISSNLSVPPPKKRASSGATWTRHPPLIV